MNDSESLLRGLDEIIADIESKDAAARVAKGALAAAEAAYKALEQDDGTLDPVELVDRRMDAHRALELARIELGRAEAAAKSAQSAHGDLLIEKCQEASDLLFELASERKKQVNEILQSLIAPGHWSDSVARDITRRAVGVADREASCKMLGDIVRGLYVPSRNIQAISNHLRSAIKHLTPNPAQP